MIRPAAEMKRWKVARAAFWAGILGATAVFWFALAASALAWLE
jgi:hypothetical protein